VSRVVGRKNLEHPEWNKNKLYLGCAGISVQYGSRSEKTLSYSPDFQFAAPDVLNHNWTRSGVYLVAAFPGESDHAEYK
jgi:hypothetical protein